MKVQNALKETGKAHDGESEDNVYVFVDSYGVLRWYDLVNNKERAAVELGEIISNDWQPYHEEKEIRPVKAGELWHRENIGDCFVISESSCAIDIVWPDGATDTIRPMTHNENGWTRLFPPVEDENMERREFNDINALSFYEGNTLKGNELPNGERAKMILEIPK